MKAKTLWIFNYCDRNNLQRTSYFSSIQAFKKESELWNDYVKIDKIEKTGKYSRRVSMQSVVDGKPFYGMLIKSSMNNGVGFIYLSPEGPEENSFLHEKPEKEEVRAPAGSEDKPEFTDLETKVFDFIEKESDPECMDCVDIDDLVRGTGESATVLRGAIASLVKKEKIEVEECDANFKVQYFYWLKGAFDDKF
jgi:hypothetical protein